MPIFDWRERALELVESGIVSADRMVLMCIQRMTNDEVEAMLDANELTPRFDDEEDDDYEVE